MKENRSISGYEMIEKIAKGGQGSIWRVKRLDSSEFLIMKRINHKNQPYPKKCINREVLYQTFLKHEHIVEMLDYFNNDNFSYFIYKSYPIDLLKFLKTWQGHSIPLKTIQKWTFQLIQAMIHLNTHQLMHRDLKLDNILLTSNSIEADIKLCDFGLIRKLNEPDSLNESDDNKITIVKNIDKKSQIVKNTLTYAGTLEYAAPELIDRNNYDLKCDVWSFGVLTHTLVYGKYPNIINGIVVFDYKNESYRVVNDLIQKCLKVNIGERIEFGQLALHEFFNCENFIRTRRFFGIHEKMKKFDILKSGERIKKRDFYRVFEKKIKNRKVSGEKKGRKAIKY